MLIGANVSMKGKGMFVGAVAEAASYGATTLQFYTGAPQNTRRKDVSQMRIPEGLADMKSAGLSHLVIHAPYIVNLGNTIKPENYPFAVQFMKEEVARADALHAYAMPFHPGLMSALAQAPPLRRLPRALTKSFHQTNTC